MKKEVVIGVVVLVLGLLSLVVMFSGGEEGVLFSPETPA